VAYDSNLNRLGYGGGFYDRYIEKIEKIKKGYKNWFSFFISENFIYSNKSI
jgi:5-formyltetrahydrofolate cyclo-ligase